MSHLRVFRNFWKPFLNHKKSVINGELEKESIIRVKTEFVPRYHHLASLGKARDARILTLSAQAQ